MEIDIRTLIMILGITHLMQVLVFYYQFRVNKTNRGIGWWLIWSGAEFIGFGVMLLRNIPSLLNFVIVIQNVMLISGTIFLYIGIRKFFNKSPNLKLIIPLYSFFTIGLLYFIFVKDDIQIRSILISATIAFVAFLTAYSLFKDKTNSISVSANFNAWIFFVHGVVFLFRMVMIMTGTDVQNFFEPSLFNLLAFFDALIVSLLWTFGLIIMLNQHLNADIFETKEDLKLIFNTSPDAAMITRLKDGLILDVNEGYTTITGYTREEMVGRTTKELNIWKNEDDRKNVVRILEKQGNCENYEAVFIDKNAKEITGLISAKIINLQGVKNIISITRNISERKRLEEEIKESDLRFKQLFENMDEAVAMHEMIYNSDGDPVDYRIIDVNYAFEKHTAISAKKARGLLATELYQVETAPYLNEYNNVVISKKSENFETRFDKLNRDFGISVIYTKPKHFATIFSNITDRKQKEAEVESLLETSEHSRKNLLSILEDQIIDQQLLAKSEDRYRSLLTNLEAGIVVHAPDTSIIMSNQRASQLLGLNNDQMKGKLAFDPDWMFITENKTPLKLEEYPVNQVIKKREPIRNRILGVVRPDTNDITWLTVNGFPVFDNTGEITEILISSFEITDRIEAEEKQRESEKVFSEMFQKSPVTILLSIPFDGTILDVNETFLREMDYNREEVIGHTTLELGIFADPSERQKLIDLLKDKQTVYGYECRFRSKKGKIMVGLLSIVFIKIKGQICQLSTVIDINARKQAEIELNNNNLFLQTLIDAIPAPVFYKNREGIYIGSNKSFENFLGQTKEEIKGKTIYEIVSQKNADQFHLKDMELIYNPGKQIYNSQIIDKTGNIHDVIFHKATILDSNNQVNGIVGIILDITENKLAEKKIKASEIRYRRLFESAKDGILILNAETGEIEDANPFIKDLLGYSKEEFLGKELWEIGLFKDIISNRESFIELQKNDYIRYEDLPLQTSDGKLINVEFVSNVYLVGNQKVVQCNIRDITERKRAEKALEHEQYLVHTLLDNIPDHIYFKDEESRFVRISRSMSQLFGLDNPSQALGKTDFDFFTKEHAQQAFDDEQEIIKSKVLIRKEEKETWANRPDTWVSTTKLPLYSKTGNVIGTFGISMDITERKNTEESLRIYTERLRNLHIIDQAILQAIDSPEEIVQTALLHMSTLLNCQRVSVGIFDFENKEVRIFASDVNNDKIIDIGTNLPEETYGDIENLRKGKIEIVEDISNLASILSINQTLNVSGVQSFINVPLLSALRLYGVLNIGWKNPKNFSAEEIEITNELASQITIAIEQASLLKETKNYAALLEKRVRDRTAQLVIANKELESFAYSISHDLRAPLRHIDGFTKLLKSEIKTESTEISHFLDIISTSASKMASMIDSLLNFSRLGRQALHKTNIDLGEIIDKIIHQFELDIKNRKIEWKIGKLPIISADLQLITFVFENLISNAIKFTSKKEIAQIEINICGKANEKCTIFVKDNGAGFNPDYAENLFGVFQRLHSNEEFEGIGIGLANVKQIINKHGGSIRAEGKLNEGATFFITI